MPMVATLLEKLTVLTVDARERARIMAILNAAVLILTSPFGWFAGRLSEVNRRYPFVLTILLSILGIILAYSAGHKSKSTPKDALSGFESSIV
jgi:hypothetical protein